MAPAFTLILQGSAVGTLALLCYQDWDKRSVSWPLFPFLFGVLLALQLQSQPAATVGVTVLVNVGLLTVLVATLRLYVYLRWPNLRLQDCLGSGDVLYWLVVAVCFSPTGFLLYLLGSSLIALLMTGIMHWRNPQPLSTWRVPLAGIQAGCLLVLLTSRWAAPDKAGYLLSENLLAALLP